MTQSTETAPPPTFDAPNPPDAPPTGSAARASDPLLLAASALLVVLVWLGLQLWGLGKEPFHTKGEPREALVVWEMTHGGGWILPKRGGLELPSKPPLFHWLGAVTSLLHGATDEWSVRMPSAALSLAGGLCVLAAGTALWNARAGVLSALALFTMFEWARAATSARVDMTLTFGLQLAFLSLLFFLRSRAAAWLVPLYLGITLAVLGKGPIGVVLPGLVAVVMIGLARDLTPLRHMRLGVGALAVSVLAGSWYVLALLLGGFAFFRKQVLQENVFTFLDSATYGNGGHRHPVVYLLGALLLGLLPWTVCLPGVMARLWRDRRTLRVDDARVYLLVWIVVVFGFYSLSASKRGVYLLALYPAAALLLGWWWAEHSRTEQGSERWLTGVLQSLSWALLVVVALLFLIVLVEGLGAPVFTSVQGWLPLPAQPYAPCISEAVRTGRWFLIASLLLAGLSLYAAVHAARTTNWLGIFAALFMTVASLTASVRQVILPEIGRHESWQPFMNQVAHVLGPDEDLFFYNTFEYGAAYYWQVSRHTHIPRYEGPWPAGGPAYLLMLEADWEWVRDSASGLYELVALPSDESPLGHERLLLVRRRPAQ